jgi:2-amino-4-hydroxy-6-hydroxymethyldihydropteridine diphosphokinase
MVETRAYVGLGANLGEPARQVDAAFDALANLPVTRLVHRSALYLSAAIEVPDAQSDYYNAAAEIHTQLAPHSLLRHLHAIETRFGRTRPGWHAARRLDLDLLLYGELRHDDAELKLPHPQLHQRAFVLLPLLEIAPALVIPGLGAAAAFLPSVAAQSVARIER